VEFMAAAKQAGAALPCCDAVAGLQPHNLQDEQVKGDGRDLKSQQQQHK
jgi:hypothetical protein